MYNKLKKSVTDSLKNKSNNILIYVYGSLKRSYHNHGYLDSAEYLGTYKTPAEYEMFSYDKRRSFPVVVKGGKPITVEAYMVSEKVIGKLDILEGEPDFYHKEIVNIPPRGKGYMYLYNHDVEGLDEVEDGIW